MKRSPIKRASWQDIAARGPQCEVRGCKRTPEADIPRCARHAPEYLFNLSKLGELGPKPVLRDDPKLERFAQDAPVHPRSAAQVKAAQAKYKQASWRKQCLKVRPAVCIARELGDCEGQLEADHVWPRSQGGPFVVENGAFVCHKHHEMKTNSELRYKRDWLFPDQIKWLADNKWVDWNEKGEPIHRGWRHFEPVVLPKRARVCDNGTT